MKNFNDTSGNRTRDLPAGSAMSQPTALLHTPTSRYHYVSPIFSTGILVGISTGPHIPLESTFCPKEQAENICTGWLGELLSYFVFLTHKGDVTTKRTA